MTAHAGGAALSSDRSRLRAEMRAKRRALSRARARRVRRDNSHASCDARNLLRPGRRVAVYVAHDSEADPVRNRATGATQPLRAVPACDRRLSPPPHGVPSATRATPACDRIATASPNRSAAPRRASPSGTSTWFWYRWSPSMRAARDWAAAPASTTAACSTCAPDAAGAGRS